MPFSNYSELQSSITDWMARNDLTGVAADFITLGEAGLNRELKQVGTTAALTGVSGQNYIDISALSIIEPRALFIEDSDAEYEMTKMELGTYTQHEFSGRPSIWSIEGSRIVFDRELDQAYPFRFVYTGRFALSDAAPTNEFLTENPDLYMAASIVWGSVYVKSAPDISMWSQMLAAFLASVKHTEARKARGDMVVDPALLVIGRRYYDRDILR
ncbi:hypothetical protein HFO71_24100 [Rhizobium laguerreae]|uniref:phage adaptor protein n=1 Tax=Rhizobium laguerreae TaxID=1076926 RepID=UPI001C90A592|nr:hypothetical protein [Rhizobium laguerreae]MBY3073401.1 hypothetical protein [Rhizobium laguerreae]